MPVFLEGWGLFVPCRKTVILPMLFSATMSTSSEGQSVARQPRNMGFHSAKRYRPTLEMPAKQSQLGAFVGCLCR